MTGPVFLTGGSGFVGGALARRLIADGRRVRALARAPGAADALRAAGAEPVRGDLLDPPSLVAGARGCEIVYHVAGVNRFCSTDPAPMTRANVDGSRNVVRAAVQAGAHRLVYTSSAATLGEASGTVGREDSPHRGWFLSDYERSKFDAERVVLRESERLGLDVVCVNPSSVQGPGRVAGTAKLLLAYLNGRLRALVDARMSLVDIADCTEGHVRAEAHGRPGERYVLSGASLTVGEAIRLLADIAGAHQRVVTLPPVAARVGGAAAEAVARVRGRHPSVCREVVRTLLHGHTYDGSKATRELGLSYTPVADTIARTVAWYVDEGLVAPAATPRLG